MLDDKPNAFQAVGLQIEGNVLKAAHLSIKKGLPVLDELFSIDTHDAKNGDAVNPLYMTENGKKLCKLLDQQLTLSALSSSETLVRPLQVKLKKDKDIADTVAFQAEPLIPYPIEEAAIDWVKVDSDEEGSVLTVFAAKRDHIVAHLESWKPLNIDPEVVSAVPAAIAAFAGFFLEGGEPCFVVHLGHHNTTCALVIEGKLIVTQFSPKGLQYLSEAVIEDVNGEEQDGIALLCNLDFENLDLEKYHHLGAALESLGLEVMRNLIALGKSAKGKDVDKVLFTGEGGGIQSLEYALSKKLGKTAVDVKIPEGMQTSLESLKRNAVSIGLALSGLPKEGVKINFRQGDLAYPNPWKRLKKTLAAYFLSCFLLAGAILLCGQAYLGFQEDTLKESYGELLAHLNKPYEVFELEFASKKPDEGYDEGDVVSIETLSGSDLYERLEYLEKQINTAPEPIALQPNTPRVSDVLAWLASHPNVVFVDADSDDKRPLVRIESFNYSMVKRPEEKKRNSPYQVKVEIEFTSPTPKIARELHDALIENNSFVDPKGEVKWSSNRGRYRTSFFLQDKTYYPSRSRG